MMDPRDMIANTMMQQNPMTLGTPTAPAFGAMGQSTPPTPSVPPPTPPTGGAMAGAAPPGQPQMPMQPPLGGLGAQLQSPYMDAFGAFNRQPY